MVQLRLLQIQDWVSANDASAFASSGRGDLVHSYGRKPRLPQYRYQMLVQRKFALDAVSEW